MENDDTNVVNLFHYKLTKQIRDHKEKKQKTVKIPESPAAPPYCPNAYKINDLLAHHGSMTGNKLRKQRLSLIEGSDNADI